MVTTPLLFPTTSFFFPNFFLSFLSFSFPSCCWKWWRWDSNDVFSSAHSSSSCSVWDKASQPHRDSQRLHGQAGRKNQGLFTPNHFFSSELDRQEAFYFFWLDLEKEVVRLGFQQVDLLQEQWCLKFSSFPDFWRYFFQKISFCILYFCRSNFHWGLWICKFARVFWRTPTPRKIASWWSLSHGRTKLSLRAATRWPNGWSPLKMWSKISRPPTAPGPLRVFIFILFYILFHVFWHLYSLLSRRQLLYEAWG